MYHVKKFTKAVLCLCALFFVFKATANNTGSSSFFIANKGQLPVQVDFATRFDQAECSYNKKGLHYRFNKYMPDERIKQSELTMSFKGGNTDVRLIPSDKSSYYENYYIGDISSNTTAVPCYGQLTYEGIYEGIDCQFYFTGNNLKYDFLLAAGACVEDIQLSYEGAKNISLDEQGNLTTKTEFGQLKELKPYTYQVINGQRLSIPSRYVLKGKLLSFEIGSYDRSRPLVIDPVSLVQATYWNRSTSDVFNDVKVDASGNQYATGSSINAGFDAVLVKFDDTGQPMWTTFFGGSGSENSITDIFYNYGQIVLDDNDNIYLTGKTNSTNLPIMGGFQTSYGGGDNDAFVAKFDASGTLLLSSYIGGTDTENEVGGGGIALDAAGNIFVGGSTRSTGFFNSTGGYQPTSGGNGKSDAFLLKISPDFSAANGTFWGDTALQVVREIVIDGNDKVWATGSSDFSPLVLPGSQALMLGDRETFLLRLSNDLTQLEVGTFLGGKFDEEVYDMALDNNDNVVLTGVTFSTTDFPVTNAFQQFYMGGREAFVSKFDNSGLLQWNTYLGGRLDEVGRGITTDNLGAVYVTGLTGSDDFPYFHSVQETYNTLNCERDAFIFKFTPSGGREWATFYGGWRTEEPNAIAVGNGQVIIVGKTQSNDLPASPGAYQTDPLFFNTWKAFLGQFEYACPSTPIIIHSTENAIFYDDFWCNDYDDLEDNYFSEDSCALELIAPPGYADYQWTRNGASVGGNTPSISTLNYGSSYEYYVTVDQGNACNSSSLSIPDTTYFERPVCFSGSFDPDELPHLAEIAQGYDTEFVCPGETISISLSTYGFCGSEFQWQDTFEDIPGETGQNYTITQAGCYRVGVLNTFTGCEVYSIHKKVVVLDSIFISGDSGINRNCAVPDTISGCQSVSLYPRIPTCEGYYCSRYYTGLNYTWYRDGNMVSSSNSYNATIDGTYTVEVTNGNCSVTSPPVQVTIQPIEAPTWVIPTSNPICIAGLDSMDFVINHPLLGDSLLVTFYSPTQSGYDIDSFTINPITSGCKRVRVEDRNGCYSYTPTIELHDSIVAEIQYNSLCEGTRLQANYRFYDCQVINYTWYQDGVLFITGEYNDDILANDAGEYILQMETACGIFSDTVNVIADPDPPTLDPPGPVCLPVSLTATAPDANPNYIYHWFLDDDCTGYGLDEFPNQNGSTLIANLPGCYYVTVEDTLSGCSSDLSNLSEVHVSLTGASIVPSQDIYNCQGTVNPNVTLNVFPVGPSFIYQWYLNNTPIPGATTATYTTSSEGAYTVYIENSCDNNTTPPVSIYNVPNPSITTSPTGTYTYCLNDTLTVNTQTDQAVLFQWYQDGAVMQGQIYDFLEVSESGTYTVQVTNPTTNCQSTSDPLIYSLDPLMSASIASIPECFGPCSGTLTATVNGGTAPFTYLWDNGNTTASNNNFCAGLHQLTVTDDIGCTATFQGEVLPGIALQLQANQITCYGGNDGSILVTPSQGVPPYTYDWDNAPDIANPTNLPAGTYQLTITDDAGCSSTLATVISEPALLSIDFMTTDIACNGSATGTISTTITGGTPPYTYTWSSPLPASTPNQLPAGTYALTISDANGCTATNSASISEPPLLGGNLTINNEISCYGNNDGSLSSTVSGGTAPYDFLWNNGNTTATANNLGAGSYQVTVSDNNGCALTFAADLIISDSLVASISLVNNISCYGQSDGSATANSTTGTPPYSYLWDNGEMTATATALYDQHSVTVTDDNGCFATAQIAITSPDLLSSNIVAIDSVSCFGQADGSINITTSGGMTPYTYNWSNGTTDQNPTGLAAGTYSLTVSDLNACSNILSLQLFEPAALGLSVSAIDSVACFGGNDGTATLAFSGGTSPFAFLWDNGETSSTALALDASIHSATITDFNGCQATTTAVIPTPDLLTVDITAIDSVNCHGGNDGSILAATTGGTAPFYFLWDNGAATSSNPNLPSGNYSLTITDFNGCTATSSALVEQPALLSSILVNTTDVTCNGLSDGAALISTSGGVPPYTFNWDNGETTATAIALDAGPHTVTVTDFYNCSNTLTVAVAEPAMLDAQVLLVDSISCAGFVDGQAQAFPAGGTAPFSYLWDNGEPTQLAASLSAGIHSVIITDANGCSISRFVVMETPLALGISSFDINNVLCNGESNGSISLSPSGGTTPYHYTWNTGQTTSSITGLPLGDYTVTVTDWNACTTLNNITITEPPTLSGQAFLVGGTSCHDSADGQARVQEIGGTLPYSVLWDNGETGFFANLLSPGQHGVSITDGNNCSWTGSIFIPSPAPLLLGSPVAATPVSCFGGMDGRAEINVIGGTTPYYYSWNGGSFTTQNVRDDLPAGSFAVAIMDANGCTLPNISLTIGSPSELVLSIDGLDAVCWNEASAAATALVSGGTPSYSYLWNNGDSNQTAQYINAGNYVVTVTDAQGCKVVESTSIGEPAAMFNDFTTVDNICHGESKGAIHITNTYGGNAPYLYALNEGSFSQDTAFTNLAAGEYLLAIQDVSGCEIIQPVLITEPDELIVDAGDDLSLILGENGQLEATVNTFSPVTWSWEPSIYLNCENSDSLDCNDPLALQPLETTAYLVAVLDENGCLATDEVLVMVQTDYDIFIPNVFTPNNDGVNDAFTVFAGSSVARVRALRVYDRWGELLFDGKNLVPNVLSMGWDGTLNGKGMNPGVFAYVAEVEFIDGRVVLFKGDVTVLR